ncbi:multicopper oxidase [Myriangium duriaei CBS 260.36]|uniref:Multicopper oxidase n=1 Tax=Myriangium duriaei CBS 260.36 TaxID=1168546 RepID=A0A9P4IWF7_9PEZI|nr:multicopper oxidase [Myriangium duriaei CBS 260.36]
MHFQKSLAAGLLLAAPTLVHAVPTATTNSKLSLSGILSAIVSAFPQASAIEAAIYSDVNAAVSAFSAAGLALPTQTATTTAIYNTAIPATKTLVPLLSQTQTNGKSNWGTVLAPLLAQFVNGPLQNGWPWGTRTANNTNYYDANQIPITGVTRNYAFTISRQTIAPDGVQVPGMLINGQFPGPLIEANWGDWISVTVTNNLTDEGTSLHWHGFLQKGTPYYDGVPGVTQCPLAPGTSFTYTFRADLYGSSWYHSHYSAQYAAGLFGPMVVHGPTDNTLGYDVDLGPVMLNDWYHTDYYTLVKGTVSKNFVLAMSNNNLINGKMNYPCPATNTSTMTCTPNAGLSKFKFTSGKKHRLRLINSGAEAVQKFSIDGHTMTVIANDFVPVKPYTTNVITLGVGQRADVIVQASGKSTDAVWMRSQIAMPCSANDGVSPNALAAVYYESANQTAVPTTTSSVDPAALSVCSNDALNATQPFLPLTPPATPAVTQELNIIYTTNSTGFNVWEINNSSFRVNYNDPTLLEAKLGAKAYPVNENVYNFGSNSSIRLVIYNYFQYGPHPMHMHGHNFYVLATGTGMWDGHITQASNPIRRDTLLVDKAPAAGVPAYIVVQIDADNPGVWPFHCHIAWHVSGGLYVNILERPNDITESNMPMVMAQTCRDWSAYTGKNVVDQIDSGL